MQVARKEWTDAQTYAGSLLSELQQAERELEAAQTKYNNLKTKYDVAREAVDVKYFMLSLKASS